MGFLMRRSWGTKAESCLTAPSEWTHHLRNQLAASSSQLRQQALRRVSQCLNASKNELVVAATSAASARVRSAATLPRFALGKAACVCRSVEKLLETASL